jgi:hypothetical protein
MDKTQRGITPETICDPNHFLLKQIDQLCFTVASFVAVVGDGEMAEWGTSGLPPNHLFRASALNEVFC